MAKTKDAYDEIVAQIAAKVQKNGSCSHSKSDLATLAQTMLNTPTHTVDVFVKNGEGEPTVVQSKPSERYRDSLRPILKGFGIDKDEQDKIQTMMMTREHAEAMMDLALGVAKDYTNAGRKLVFPINSADETQMAIRQVAVPEKKSEPHKIIPNPDNPAVKISVPTGKKVTTKAHMAMKSSNKVPGWLRDVKEDK